MENNKKERSEGNHGRGKNKKELKKSREKY
jgi:hypothetical protein